MIREEKKKEGPSSTVNDSRSMQDGSRFTNHELPDTSHDSRFTSHDVAISVANLSKKYRLYDSPKHRLKEALHPFRKKYHHDFWALRDVSFEVKKGETFGIIGKNGSGKSTLLQIICGILQPTGGVISVNGKISALLELGAGFNPEFTGRQNVYMNGALLGFSREEMDERFQGIAEFADIGEFVDQPVKTYSSGMYVRLAFAVAINVNPEILIVDEALSVGDMFFQAKCMTRMKKMIDNGVTLLFVSHDTGSIKSLCKSAVYLKDGIARSIGNAEFVVNQYLKSVRLEEVDACENEIIIKGNSPEESMDIGNLDFDSCQNEQGYGSKEAKIEQFCFINSQGSKSHEFDWGEDVSIYIISKFFIPASKYSVGFLIRDIYGLDVFGTNLKHENVPLPFVDSDKMLLSMFGFKLFLQPGNYTMTFAVSIIDHNGVETICDWHDNVLVFKINKTSLSISDTKVYIPTKSEAKLI